MSPVRPLVSADAQSLFPAFQPIVCLRTGRVVGYEALLRSKDRRNPAQLFADAAAADELERLEALAIELALAVPDRMSGTYLAVNVSPGALWHPDVAAALDRDLRGVVIEITEHERAHAAMLRDALGPLRERGARIAVDDAGAGYSGLQQILEIEPDLIKLDRALVSGVAEDRHKQALVSAFVSFAGTAGMKIVAEGVERLDDLRALADRDVDCAQGYGLCVPREPWPTVSELAAVLLRRGSGEALALTADDAPGASLEALWERLSFHVANSEEVGDLHRVVPALARLLGAKRITFSVYDPPNDLLHTLGGDDWQATPEVYPLAEYPLTRHVLVDQVAVQVLSDDPDADRAEIALMEADGFRGLLMIPIVARGRPVGLLEAYRADSQAWKRSELRWATALCHQIGAFIDRAAGVSTWNVGVVETGQRP